MNILGIVAHTMGYGDSAAALVMNGVVVGAVEEERFSRKRYDDAFPEQSIRWLLRDNGLTGADIDLISVHLRPRVGMLGRLGWILRGLPRNIPGGLEHWRYLRRFNSLQTQMRDILGRDVPYVGVPHHLSHATAALCASGFERAAFMTLDGAGEGETGSWGIGSCYGAVKWGSWDYPHSLGLLYSAVGEHIGFPPPAGPGKVMGLAAYGDPERFLPLLRKVAFVQDGKPRLDLSYMDFHLTLATPVSARPWVSRKFEKKCGIPRRAWLGDDSLPLAQEHIDLAAALQARVNELGLELARFVRRQTGESKLCLSGGVALNSVMNGVLDEAGIFDEIFIFPAPGDAGNAVGSAILAGLERDVPFREYRSLPYCGPSFAETEIERELAVRKLPFERVADGPKRVAARVLRGDIAGWFQGGMEFGPRALGNRSILADPSIPDMKDILNQRVKHREWFRPFAPAVPVEYFERFFEGASPDPYMLKVARVRSEWRDRLPAITHVDGTARVQAVSREGNPQYHELMLEMERQGGLPVVLNTSFNDQEPIVCTPEHAVRCYLGTNIDCLLIGNYYLEKRRG